MVAVAMKARSNATNFMSTTKLSKSPRTGLAQSDDQSNEQKEMECLCKYTVKLERWILWICFQNGESIVESSDDDAAIYLTMSEQESLSTM